MIDHRAHASADYGAGTNTAKCTCGWEQVWTVFDGSAEMAADYHEREAVE